jgi:hypothetical protein
MGPSLVLSFPNVTETPILVRSGQCLLTAVLATNDSPGKAFVQLFDAARAQDVILGTTRVTWAVEAAASGLSTYHNIPPGGLLFHRGLVVASTTQGGGGQGASQHIRICLEA